MSIRPTQNFVLIQFKAKDGEGTILMPDGQRNPNGDIVVLAVGPDVPKEPTIVEGSKVLLRGDAKIYGIDDKAQTACVLHVMIMAVVDEALTLPTNEEIDRIASGK